MSQVRHSESRPRWPSRPPRPRRPARPRGGGVRSSPPTRARTPLSRPLSGPSVTAPSSRRAPLRHSPSFVWVLTRRRGPTNLCVSRPTRRSTQRRLGLRQPARPWHPSTPARPRASGGAGTREDPSARPPRRRPLLPPPRIHRVPHCPPAGWRGPALTHGPLSRGVPSPRLQKRRPGRARWGRHPDGQRNGGKVPAPPPPRAGLQSHAGRRAAQQRRVTWAPARAAPARRSRALPLLPPPPPPPGLHRLLRPSGCRTLPDRAPNPAAQSPSLLFGPPVQPSAAPIGGTRAGSRPITGPAGRRGAEPAPRRGARGTRPGWVGGARARARVWEPKDAGAGPQSGSAAQALCSFTEGSAPFRKGMRSAWTHKCDPRAGGRQGGVAGTGRKAGRRARSAWREPPSRSSRAGGGRGGAERQVWTSSKL